jgi:hypothetical protein
VEEAYARPQRAVKEFGAAWDAEAGNEIEFSPGNECSLLMQRNSGDEISAVSRP